MDTQSQPSRTISRSRTRSLAALAAAGAIALSATAAFATAAQAEPMQDTTPAGIDTTHNGGDGVTGPVVNWPTFPGAYGIGGGA